MKKFLLKLVQTYFLKTETTIRGGDLVTHINNDFVYEAMGIYYSYELKPFLFIRDPLNGKVYGVPLREYKRVSNPNLIANSTY